MPAPGPGYGRDWGGGGNTGAPKHPSAMYDIKVENREYGGDEKQKRDEMRRQQMEERMRQRQQQAGNDSQGGYSGGGSSEQNGASNGHADWKQWGDGNNGGWKQDSEWKSSEYSGGSAGGWQEKGGGESGGWQREEKKSEWSQPDGNSWKQSEQVAAGEEKQAAQGDWQKKDEWKKDDWSSWKESGDKQWTASSSDQKTWSSSDWNKKGWTDSKSQETGSSWQPSGDADKPRNIATGLSQEAKAQRAAQRAKEALERKKAREQAEGGSAQESAFTPMQNSAPPSVRVKVKLSNPHQGLTDAELAKYCENEAVKLSDGEQRTAFADDIDLSGNHLTDSGLQTLVDFLCEHKVRLTHLRLTGNDLQEPHHALGKLLMDRDIGVTCNFNELHLSIKNLAGQALWRICEVVYNVKSLVRRPLRLYLDTTDSDASKQSELEEVLKQAAQKSLNIAGDFGECLQAVPEEKQHSFYQMFIFTAGSRSYSC